MDSEDFELLFGTLSRADATANSSAFTPTDRLSAGSRRVNKLSWTYARPGGCDQLEAVIYRPYDQPGGIDQLRDVILRVRGQVWWRGYVVSRQPKLDTPETWTIRAMGYAHRAEEANFTWYFGRQALKNAGDVGDITGIVLALWQLAPLMIGQADSEAHALGDGTPRRDMVAYRPAALHFQNQTLFEIFSILAEMAGNFDWGVDENRQFYFIRPQLLTPGVVMQDPMHGDAWGTSGQYAADESYLDPQSVPTYTTDHGHLTQALQVENAATFVVGGNVRTYDPEQSVGLTKNVLVVYGSPPRAGQPTPSATVVDSDGVARWGRRMIARVSAPGFFQIRDLVQWAAQRLRLLSREQFRGGVKVSERFTQALLVHPLGAARVISDSSGAPVVERITGVAYEMSADGTLTTTVNLGYGPPPDRVLGRQLRQDATLTQNVNVDAQAAFFLRAMLPFTTAHQAARFLYCGLGTDNGTALNGNDLNAPLLNADGTPFRELGTAVVTGSIVTVTVQVPAGDVIVTGNPSRAIVEAALYLSTAAAVGEAAPTVLHRFLFPAPLVIGDESNDLQLVFELDCGGP